MSNSLIPTNGSVIPTTPEEIFVEVGIDAVKQILDVAKDIVRTRQIEETKREAIRAQAEIAIKQIETDSSKKLDEIRKSHEERMRTIDIVGKALCSADVQKCPALIDAFTRMLQAVNVGGGYNG